MYNNISKFSNLNLDKWYLMGYLRSRGAVRLAVVVRECPFLLVKLSKFNSLITYCQICPLNWLYCSKIDAQRLDFFLALN